MKKFISYRGRLLFSFDYPQQFPFEPETRPFFFSPSPCMTMDGHNTKALSIIVDLFGAFL